MVTTFSVESRKVQPRHIMNISMNATGRNSSDTGFSGYPSIAAMIIRMMKESSSIMNC